MNLILLHGALGAASQWEPFLPIFKKSFDVHCVEFAGHGTTPADSTAYEIDAFADQLAAFIAAHELAPANLFGYSMGGYVALHLAHRRPELVARIMTLATKFAWTAEAVARETQKLNPDTIALGMPAYAATLQHRHTAVGWRDVLGRTAALMERLGQAPVVRDEELTAIRQPVCIGIGEWDTMVSVDESAHAAQLLPNGDLRMFPETRHPLERVDGEALAKEMEKFFRG